MVQRCQASKHYIALWIDSDVSLFATVLLDIPVIGIFSVRPVSYPDPAIGINVSAFPLLGTMTNCVLLDNGLSIPVLIQMRRVWHRPTGR